MKRLLVFNLATDADDPVLGFACGWLAALAARVEHVDVVTMRRGATDGLPDNVTVRSVGKERGYGEPRRALEFFRILGGLLRRHRYDACFAHMMPLFAVLGWPLLRARRIPVTLWYAHRATGPVVRLAARLVDHVVTPSAESFRVSGAADVRIVGHGIDLDDLPVVDGPAGPPHRLVVIGRIAAVKRLELLVEALPHVRTALGPEVSLHLVGPAEAACADGLRALAGRLGVGDLVHFDGAVPHRCIADALGRATVVVNVSATGSIDKAVLEAMASGVPVVVANEAFGFLPAECRTVAEPGPVASAIVGLARLEPAERAALGGRLREIVARDHALPRLADLLVDDVLLAGAR